LKSFLQLAYDGEYMFIATTFQIIMLFVFIHKLQFNHLLLN